MAVDQQEQWPEHAVCARCAAPLTDDYRQSPLGLRFCKDCFDGTIQEKVKERAAAIYVKGRCSKCGKSLINGYRLNQFGVLHCLSCSDVPSKTAESSPASEEENVEEQTPAMGRTEIFLIILLITAHLLFFADFLLSGRLLHGQKFFRPLVTLDLLTLILLLVSRRLSASWLTTLLTLLLVSGFIILVVREVLALA